jgi:hypothetical protein
MYSFSSLPAVAPPLPGVERFGQSYAICHHLDIIARSRLPVTFFFISPHGTRLEAASTFCGVSPWPGLGHRNSGLQSLCSSTPCRREGTKMHRRGAGAPRREEWTVKEPAFTGSECPQKLPWPRWPGRRPAGRTS